MLSNAIDTRTDIPTSNVIAVVQTGSNAHRLIYASDEGVTEDIPVGMIRHIITSDLPQSYINEYEAHNLLQHHNDQQSSIHVIVSVASGAYQAQKFYASRLVPVLQALGLEETRDYTLHLTTSEDSITELTKNTFTGPARNGNSQTIILLSGDGGMVDIINGLWGSPQPVTFVPPTIALLPLGTANALAHSLKLTGDNTMGLSNLLRGRSHALPVFKANFSPGARLLANEGNDALPLARENSLWGSVVASWGLHAALVADSDTTEYRKHGIDRFKMAAKENLFPSDSSEPHRYIGKLSLLREESGKWEKVDRNEHAYVLATFVSNLEKTFTISPASKPLDGKLRVIHFGPMDGNEVMTVMGSAYQGGKHVEHDQVTYESVEGLRIEFEEEDERWRRVCFDGKIVRVEKGGWVEVSGEERGWLNVLCLEA